MTKFISLLALLVCLGVEAQPTFTGNVVGGNISGNGAGLTNLQGAFFGTNSGTNALGVSGNVSAIGGGTPYSTLFYPGVPVGFDSWPQHGSVYTATQFTNDILRLWNSYPLPLYASGMPFWFVVDEGWARTNSNGSIYRDANGKLAMNPLLWPDQPSNYVAFAHAHHVALMLYTQFLGVTGAPSGTGLPNPLSQGTNIELDAQTFAGWGMDGAKADTGGSMSSTNQILPCLVQFETAFRQAAVGRPSYFLSDLVVGGGANSYSDYALFGGALSGTVYCPNSDWAETGSSNYLWAALITNVNVCANWQYAAAGTKTWVEPRDMINNYQPDSISYAAEKMYAELGAPMRLTCISEAEASQLNWLTNSELFAIQQDALHQTAQPLAGIGSSNTYQIWSRNLVDGSIAQAWLNCTTNTVYTITLNWTNFGQVPTRSFLVRDAFDNTNIATSQIASLTLTVSNFDCLLLRLYPNDNPAPVNSAELPTPIPYTNLPNPWGNFIANDALVDGITPAVTWIEDTPSFGGGWVKGVDAANNTTNLIWDGFGNFLLDGSDAYYSTPNRQLDFILTNHINFEVVGPGSTISGNGSGLSNISLSGNPPFPTIHQFYSTIGKAYTNATSQRGFFSIPFSWTTTSGGGWGVNCYITNYSTTGVPDVTSYSMGNGGLTALVESGSNTFTGFLYSNSVVNVVAVTGTITALNSTNNQSNINWQ